jgi:acetyl/propionyl-CoA carboxylase alpha subunit
MFRKVLVANRGEIACRVFATLDRLGIASVAVYSEADRDALHVRRARQAVAIGPAEPAQSYLNVEALIRAAQESGAEAIHPGYGFLAENAEFAAAVEKAGLVFIGPSPEHARVLGSKLEARAAAQAAGVPVVPGTEIAAGDAAAARDAAKSLGYPVIVKAALGGGGKGMQMVREESELAEALESAARVARSAFGDAAVYLEKHLERPRHVEVQIFGDGLGRALHLFERECTLQRRHQKVMEESPSPALGDLERRQICEAAVKLVRSIGYRGAGTVEFLWAGGSFYFLEVNTRLQVEHPVTEWLTGLDLVELQLEVAADGRLHVEQSQVARRGHAVEARLYAEDPLNGFLPQAGRVLRCEFPAGPFLRVDAGIEAGSSVPVNYDPILAKLTAWGADRAQAWARLAAALDHAVVHGVVTNLPFLRALARHPAVLEGRLDTELIEREFLPAWSEGAGEVPDRALVAAAISELLDAGAGAAGRDGSASARQPVPDPFLSLGRWRLPGLD